MIVHVEDEWRALVRSSSRNHCIAWQATIPLAKFAKVVAPVTKVIHSLV
jgi:hypothetical protein